ncbi:TIGR00659 family protein [Psychrobacillus sp. OK028]|uniref:LrgB family protein n=1 Tax=Psychrobacillus sp. OK028 TaxID=1884359 RepID=UPI00087FCBD6|nr:LrgB family protein [Psychrobacillus sp. OK028]SDM49664.1 TIGR00659 family protein [Psychrobacillus sp. OK028]
MIAVLMIIGTIVLFYLMTIVYKRFTYPLLIPIFSTTVLLVLILVTNNIPYDTYMSGGKWINELLGPAVVSMAYPLYIHREKIIKYKVPIILSVLCALLSGLVSITVLSRLLSFEEHVLLSLLPKSITTPVAIPISEAVGGVPTLTAVFVIFAGLVGAILGPIIFRVCRIDQAISRGISVGSASHGIGVSKLTEYGEETLTMGSVSMTLSAILGSFVCPLFALLI